MSRSLRFLSALALFAVAADHLYEYFGDHYSAIPTIGTLFLLNGAGATALGFALLVPLGRLASARRRKIARCVVAVAGIALAGLSMVGLLVAESTPLFGFMEVGYRPVVVLALVSEGIAVGSLTALIASLRRSPPQERLTTTPRSGVATMGRSKQSIQEVDQ